MQQLASRDPYYNILAPQVAGNLSTDEYDSLFQTYKVIYPDYAGRHSVDEIIWWWTLWHNVAQSFSTLRTSISWLTPTGSPNTSKYWITQPRHSILDILNWYYPAWKTHQHLDAFTKRSTTVLPLTPHPDTSDTGLVVRIRIQSIPRGHPFYSPTL